MLGTSGYTKADRLWVIISESDAESNGVICTNMGQPDEFASIRIAAWHVHGFWLDVTAGGLVHIDITTVRQHCASVRYPLQQCTGANSLCCACKQQCH